MRKQKEEGTQEGVEVSTEELKAWKDVEVKEAQEKQAAKEESLQKSQQKIEDLESLEGKKLKKKALAKARSVLKKPHVMMIHLQNIGDDFVSATEEKISEKRIAKIFDNYTIAWLKYSESRSSAKDYAATYPTIVEASGVNLDTPEVPQPRDDRGRFNIMTSEGIVSGESKK